MLMTAAGAVLVCLPLAAGCRDDSPPTHAEQERFRARPPAHWVDQTREVGDEVETGLNHQVPERLKLILRGAWVAPARAATIVIAEFATTPSWKLRRVTRELIALSKRASPDFQLASLPTPAQVDRQEAVSVEYVGRGSGGAVKVRLMTVRWRDRVYVLSLTTGPSTFAEYAREFEGVLAAWTWT